MDDLSEADLESNNFSAVSVDIAPHGSLRERSLGIHNERFGRYSPCVH
jgi:hypothetical protein